jgi:iron complex outermembrane receptor protein
MIFAGRQFGDSSLLTRLMVGTAFSALALGAAQAQPANNAVETVVVTGTNIRGAQPTGSNLITVDRTTIETTGAQNVVELMANVPGITNFGNASATGGNSDGAGGFAPAIHNIGGGSSSATLVLINGHRFPTQGLTEAQADPTAIPASALERVEVLPDGASSTYGSDAVAGVLNFITRKNFNGAEFATSYGIADHYNTFNVSGVFGTSWTGGSALVAVDVSTQSNLYFGQRSFTTGRQDIRRGQFTGDPNAFTGANTTTAPSQTVTIGGVATVIPAATVTPAAGPGTTVPGGLAIPALSDGVNYQTFNCPVATISPTGTNAAYYYQPSGGYGGQPYYTATTNLPSQGFCDSANGAVPNVTTLLPSSTRNSGLFTLNQEITSNLSFDLEAVYASRITYDHSSRGTIANATVFGPNAAAGAGSNATTIAAAAAGEVNPFYVGNAATGQATELVRGYSFDALLGPGAYTKQLATNTFATAGLTWDLGNNQEITLSGTVGDNFNGQHVSGVVSPAEAFLALDGTPTGGGVPGTIGTQDVFGLGTSYPVSRVLNTTNALDVWTPAGSANRTSQQVINSLKSNQTFTNANQGLQDLIAKFDGPVFDLPAGSVKIAVGGEYMHATMDEYGTSVNAAGPTFSNSNAYYYREGRTVKSAFLEINAPIVSEEMGVPLMQSFSIDVSGRYDKYSDVGDTKNPKVAFDWVITDGLKLRGSHGTSFVAPTVHDTQQFNSQSNIGAAPNFANPIIPFGDTRPFNGGAGLAGTWVSTAAGCTGGNGTVVQANGSTFTGAAGQVAFGCKVNFGAQNVAGSTSAGFSIPGGNNNLHPATGRSDEFGVDLDFGRLIGFDGLIVNLTYWDINYRGLITNQQTQNNVPQLSTFAPIGGWNPTDAAIQSFIANRPLTIAMPTKIWYLFDQRLQNAFNIWENGIDFAVNYTLRTDDLGTFRFGLAGNELLRYTTQAAVAGAPLLNTLYGKNAPRYPSAEMQARFSLGWAYDAFSSTLSVNYQHPTNGAFSTYPYNLPDTQSSPTRGYLQGAEGVEVLTSGGNYHVPGFVQFNLSTNYALPTGFLGLPVMATNGMSVSLNIDNILDNNPSFSPANVNGYVNGNPIGRLVTIGLKKKF